MRNGAYKNIGMYFMSTLKVIMYTLIQHIKKLRNVDMDVLIKIYMILPLAIYITPCHGVCNYKFRPAGTM